MVKELGSSAKASLALFEGDLKDTVAALMDTTPDYVSDEWVRFVRGLKPSMVQAAAVEDRLEQTAPNPALLDGLHCLEKRVPDDHIDEPNGVPEAGGSSFPTYEPNYR